MEDRYYPCLKSVPSASGSGDPLDWIMVSGECHTVKTEILTLQGSETPEARPRTGIVALETVTVVDFAVVSSITPAQPTKFDPPKHGNLAQWAAVIVALVIAVGNIALTFHFHSEQTAASASDEHTNQLIDEKLQPAVKEINENTDRRAESLNNQLSDLNRRVGITEGELDLLKNGFKKQALQQEKLNDRLRQQEALNRLQDPNRTLAAIRAEIQDAESSNRKLPESDLAVYRDAIHALAPSAANYWVTMAAIINYQSRLNQMSGEAPDPSEVARPCLDENSIGNVFSGVTFPRCTVVLDNEAFDHVVFQDSVIFYHGGPVSLNNVRFVNCTFKLELTSQPGPPPQKNLLLALLDSPNQKTVEVPRE